MQTSSSSLRRFLGIIMLVGGVAGLAFEGNKYLSFENSSGGERLQYLWEQDIEKLRVAGRLPAGWNDLKEIELNAATDQSKSWLPAIKVPLEVRANGKHKMEVLILSWEEGSVHGAIIQYNLIDLKTNNMIWELGRTFVLKGDPDLEKLNLREDQSKVSVAPKEVPASSLKK